MGDQKSFRNAVLTIYIYITRCTVMCIILLPESAAVISLSGVNRLVFMMEIKCFM
jgi:hypothetical protein